MSPHPLVARGYLRLPAGGSTNGVARIAVETGSGWASWPPLSVRLRCGDGWYLVHRDTIDTIDTIRATRMWSDYPAGTPVLLICSGSTDWVYLERLTQKRLFMARWTPPLRRLEF